MKPKIAVSHLFEALDIELIKLLESLNESDWEKPTVAGNWRVKDVVAHLLDGNIRALSTQRDRHFGASVPESTDYQGLVEWLNKLNGDWVSAMDRISPAVLITLHRTTGLLTSSYFASLDPVDEAIFAVDWAGESKSYNWMHLAREYTEKWHHQQQIRDAVGIEGIMTMKFYPPFIETYMMGLPRTFEGISAQSGACIKVVVSSDLGGTWHLTNNNNKWSLSDFSVKYSDTEVTISPQIAWKLFSKNIRPEEIADHVMITGDQRLGRQVLEMVSVMA